MYAAAEDDDEADLTGGGTFRHPEEIEQETRFRSAAKTGKTCGACAKALAPDEPVWRIRRKYDGTRVEIAYDIRPPIYETEAIVAPICASCWHNEHQQTRIALSGPCNGCGRTVHLTLKALKKWLAHGRRIYCCEDCISLSVPEPAVFTKTCENKSCGKSFTPRRLDARFCSGACRVTASREK